MSNNKTPFMIGGIVSIFLALGIFVLFVVIGKLFLLVPFIVSVIVFIFCIRRIRKISSLNEIASPAYKVKDAEEKMRVLQDREHSVEDRERSVGDRERLLQENEARLTSQLEQWKAEEQKRLEEHQSCKEAEQEKIDEQMKAIEMQRADLKAWEDSVSMKSLVVPVQSFLGLFLSKLETITSSDFVGENHSNLLNIYEALTDSFRRNGLLPPDMLVKAGSDIHRIDQIEAIMAQYREKIKRIREDVTMDEAEKQEEIDYWQRLRDSHIAKIEG